MSDSSSKTYLIIVAGNASAATFSGCEVLKMGGEKGMQKQLKNQFKGSVIVNEIKAFQQNTLTVLEQLGE